MWRTPLAVRPSTTEIHRSDASMIQSSMLHHKLLSAFHIPRLREPVFFDQGRTVFVRAMVHYGDFWEVAMRRGAGGGDPFQRVAFPRVLRGFLPPDPASDEVDREENLRDSQAQS